MNSEAIELGRVRSKFLREAVLWVGELARRDRIEAAQAACELRRYFESVLNSLPPDDRGGLSEAIQDVCERLDEYGLSTRR